MPTGRPVERHGFHATGRFVFQGDHQVGEIRLRRGRYVENVFDQLLLFEDDVRRIEQAGDRSRRLFARQADALLQRPDEFGEHKGVYEAGIVRVERLDHSSRLQAFIRLVLKDKAQKDICIQPYHFGPSV